jgi:hypothetical protein
MKRQSNRSWNMERASITRKGATRSDSNKYSHSDSKQVATSGRERIWVGGYSRQNGTHVHGYYRSTPNH